MLAIHDNAANPKNESLMNGIEKRGGNGRVIGFFVVILCLDFEQEQLKDKITR
jgi:hypothetical protein